MNLIHKISLSLIFCLFIIRIEVNAQGSIGPITSDSRTDLIRVNLDPVSSDGLLNLNTIVTIGRSGNSYRNAVYQWNIPDNLIPDNSSIDNIQIYFTYTKSDYSYELPAAFYSLSEDITNGSTSNLGQMWSDMSSTSLDRITGINDNGFSKMIYSSNNSTNPLNVGFRNSLSNNRFVLGVRWDVESVNRQWFIDNSDVTITVHFTPPQQSVFVDQLLNDGSTRIGKIKLWGVTSFSNPPLDPGQNFNFYVNSHQIIQGDQTEYSNEKYNNWNSLSDVSNQHDFSISTETASLTSWFKQNYYGVKIRNAIEGLSNKDGGILYFKDPWLIDSVDQNHANTYMNRGNDAIYNNINSPLNFSNGSFSNYKGIFLNQENLPSHPVYSVKTPEVQNINLGSPQGTHKFYYQNYSSTGTSALTQNNYVNGSYETPIVFTSGDAIVNANLKGVQLSSTSTAFESNSQRKIIRTVHAAALFQVYESMGNIYLERSTDNGQTWDIYNHGNPGKNLNEYPAHSPSIDYLSGDEGQGDYLFITFEENWQIKIVCVATKINLQFSAIISDLNYPDNGANPVVSCFGTNKIMVVWKDADLDYNDGLVCRHGTVNTNGSGSFTWSEEFDDNTFISYTNQSSQNPSIDIYKDGTSQIYRLAWDDYDNVYYCDLKINSNNVVFDSNLVVVSDYAGFTSNFKPSITAVNGGARITWIGYRVIHTWNGRFWIESEEQDAAFMDPSNLYQSWAFGNAVQSVSINKSTDCYSLAWARNNNDFIQFTDSHTLQTITSLGNKGVDVQISNGGDQYSMIAAAFNNSTPPYFFDNRSLYSLNKSGTNSINSGREVVISKGKARFYFGLGDVKLDNKPVDFISLPDTTKLNSLDQINNYLTTKPIQMKDLSALNYTVQFGYTDSLAAVNSLKGKNFVNFKVELLDAKTDQVIQSLDSAKFYSMDVLPRNNISYNLNTNGLGNRFVKIRLKAESSPNFNYSLKNRYATDDVMNKISLKNQVVQNLSIVKTYDLSQNFPNPFNPSTTIKYQIPKSGQVTLKVYDILGKEVANLVNEFKNEGKYDVNFDASKLASGIYIYQLKSNEYTSSKKMMLLK
ncbi:MAG: T9SS type A sorting domain-containing protein [Ignavibacteriaceae bacterium]|nr:T9SS type A sorting domain-containing protein [Ignavibacteriaceae bacterium]